MDVVFIKNLKVRGRHGVSDIERTKEQEFLVDIVVGFDARAASESDDLADTINYGVFRSGAKDIVEQKSFHLIEALADSIAQKILEDMRVENVSVTIRKPDIYRDCTAGVTIVRNRI